MRRKVNYIQDPKTKRMAGSRPNPVDAPANGENPWASNVEETADGASQRAEEVLANLDSISAIMPALRNNPKDYERGVFSLEFLTSDHPVAQEVNQSMDGLDTDQRMWLVDYRIAQLQRELSRNSDAPQLYALADKDEWQLWCQLQAERLEDQNPALAQAYLMMADERPPTNLEFAYLSGARAQCKMAAVSYDREKRYLAAYLGKDVEGVSDALEAALREYRENPQRPAPQWFARSIESEFWGSTAIKSPPRDPGTLWAMHAVLTDRDRTAHVAPDNSDGYVVFDTETTGVSARAAIVQITAIRYDKDGVEQERLSTYIRPDDEGVFDTPEAASAGAITGITAETVSQAPRFAEVAPQLREMMSGRTLVAHNIMFDYPKVQKALADTAPEGSDPVDSIIPRGLLVDTMRLARWTHPNPGVPAKEWRHTLEASCKRANIPFNPDEAHDALYDVERTNQLFLVSRSAPLGGPSTAQ